MSAQRMSEIFPPHERATPASYDLTEQRTHSSNSNMEALHIGNWGQTLLEQLQKDGHSKGAIVGNTGIDISRLDGDDPQISFQHLALLFERAATLTENDLIGFELGQNSDYRRGGLLSYTGVSSPTVRTLLENLARFQRVTGDALQINIDFLETTGEIAWRYHVPREVIRRQYVEFNSASLIGIMRRLTNRSVTPLAVEYRHFRNSNTASIRRFFGCEIAFGASDNRIKFKLQDLELPLHSADEHLHSLLTRFSQDILDKRKDTAPSLIIQVEECFARATHISQSEVAKKLGMSTRTLSRRLAEEGTNYQNIVDGYRVSMAKRMLSHTDFQLTEIAYVLGYSDPSTFSTAFKRWTTKTPSEYRTRGV